MTFQELQVASYLMKEVFSDEKSYLKIASMKLDLNKDTDTKAVLKLLNDWGCRQFKKEDHPAAGAGMKKWYKKYARVLPSHSQTLSEQSDKKIKSYSGLFDDLQNAYASTDTRGYQKTVGPVGAAKTHFALRKHTFPPWDNPIIKELKKSKDGEGYVSYLFDVKVKISVLKSDCDKHGIDISKIPMILSRPHVSLVKLIDEYLWLTITKKCEPGKIIEIVNKAR